MTVSKQPGHHFLYSSTLIVAKNPTQIQTVLGSCVSVCLFDTKNKIGGMNHFMLPFWNGDGLATAKYGNIAIEKLLERMLACGAENRNLVAKIFGGADLLGKDAFYSIGKRNIKVAEDILAELKIPIIASSVGGVVGRKIMFETATGNIYMKFVNDLATATTTNN